MSENSSIKIARLITLEKKFRMSESETELEFTCVNELRSIIEYSFLFFLTKSTLNKLKVKAISDISVVDRTAPAVTFIETLIKKDHIQSDVISELSLKDLQNETDIVLPENFPNQFVIVPLISPTIGNIGYWVMVRSERATNTEKELLLHISETFSHALSLFNSKNSIISFFQKVFTGWVKWVVITLIAAVMFMPINMSALAPVEVIAKDPSIITSPVNGVIEKVLVNTNDPVSIGDDLVKLDDLNFKNNYEISLQELEVAEAELLRVKQSSFTNPDDKAKIVELSTEVGLKKKETAYAKEQLNYSVITAETKGVAVVEDSIDWQGRPVRIGEKILTIANPNQVEFLIFLPTKDSLLIKNSAEVKVFLDSDPLNSLRAEVIRTSYKPELTPENILAYRIYASIDNNIVQNPRIGLRGTAKIYGEKTSLFYYLFRVPINLTRQFVGF